MPDHGTMISEISALPPDALSEGEWATMKRIQELYQYEGELADERATWLERVYAKVCRGPG